MAHYFLFTVPPPPDGECGGPDDGLRPVLKEMEELFPTIEFLTVFLEALSYDDEVVQFFVYLQGNSFGRIVYDVGQMEEWRHVILIIFQILRTCNYQLAFTFNFSLLTTSVKSSAYTLTII